MGKAVFHPVVLELEGLCVCKYLLVWTVFASLCPSLNICFSHILSQPGFFTKSDERISQLLSAMLKLLFTVSREAQHHLSELHAVPRGELTATFDLSEEKPCKGQNIAIEK